MRNVWKNTDFQETCDMCVHKLNCGRGKSVRGTIACMAFMVHLWTWCQMMPESALGWAWWSMVENALGDSLLLCKWFWSKDVIPTLPESKMWVLVEDALKFWESINMYKSSKHVETSWNILKHLETSWNQYDNQWFLRWIPIQTSDPPPVRSHQSEMSYVVSVGTTGPWDVEPRTEPTNCKGIRMDKGYQQGPRFGLGTELGPRLLGMIWRWQNKRSWDPWISELEHARAMQSSWNETAWNMLETNKLSINFTTWQPIHGSHRRRSGFRAEDSSRESSLRLALTGREMERVFNGKCTQKPFTDQLAICHPSHSTKSARFKLWRTWIGNPWHTKGYQTWVRYFHIFSCHMLVNAVFAFFGVGDTEPDCNHGHLSVTERQLGRLRLYPWTNSLGWPCGPLGGTVPWPHENISQPSNSCGNKLGFWSRSHGQKNTRHCNIATGDGGVLSFSADWKTGMGHDMFHMV